MSDLPQSIIGLATVWVVAWLYGMNVVLFYLCITILSQKRSRQENISPFLVAGVCLQFSLSTAHAITNFGAGLSAFSSTPMNEPVITLLSNWISLFGPYTEASQILFSLNLFTGDLILIWRLFVVYSRNFYIATPPLILAMAAIGANLFSTTSTITEREKILTGGQHVLNDVVTAGWALGATTQILVTLLIAGRIYWLSRNLSSRYTGIIWILVESGASMAIMQVIFIGVWRTNHNVIAEFLLGFIGQFCALVPLTIIIRIGKGYATAGSIQSSAGYNSNSVNSRGRLLPSHTTSAAGREVLSMNTFVQDAADSKVKAGVV